MSGKPSNYAGKTQSEQLLVIAGRQFFSQMHTLHRLLKKPTKNSATFGDYSFLEYLSEKYSVERLIIIVLKKARHLNRMFPSFL